MENIRPDKRMPRGLPIAADMLNHRGEIALQPGEKLGNLVQSPFNCFQAHPRCPISSCGLLASSRQATSKDAVEILRRPAKCHRQRFQSSRATATLDGMALNFPDDRWRHMRALREFALAPSKLIYALIDGVGNRRPILRHSFLRARAFGAEISRSPSFRDTTQAFTRRDSASAQTQGADFSAMAMKSAIARSGESLSDPQEGRTSWQS
jgi:hypothetical protein